MPCGYPDNQDMCPKRLQTDVEQIDKIKKPKDISMCLKDIENHIKTFHTPYTMDLFKKLTRKIKPEPKVFRYLITFTLKEKKQKSEAKKYIISVAERRSTLKIKKLYLAEETTKKGMPHWHMAIETEKFLAKNRFNYYGKKFGFVDISKTSVNTIQEALNYISKSTTPIKLI